MAGHEEFTRRICAILLADVTGYSALVGADDERTARSVRELQDVVCEIVVAAKGQAEPRAGDAIFATFDSVVAAVDAGLAILQRVSSQEFTGQRLQVRIGLHFGDVLRREGGALGDAVGEAINIAARLEGLAKPGTICISEGVYQHVRNKVDARFVDLGRQKLKNIVNPVHAYLILLADHGSPRRRVPLPSRRMALGGALALIVGIGAALLVPRLWDPSGARRLAGKEDGAPVSIKDAVAPVSDEPLALGVMLFKGRGEASDDDWRCEALRDGLNAQLSRLSQVKVYSKEFIDFLIRRKGLSEIEAATQLGIRKMLSGSYVATQHALEIEIHVVDVQTGVLETSYTASGSQQNFLELQKQLTLGVVSQLQLPVTDEEKQMLLAQRNTDADALKLLMQVEGGLPAEGPTPGQPEPRSQLNGVPWWSIVRRAQADDQPAAEAAVRDVVERYRRAMEAGQVAEIAQLYTQFPPELQNVQQRYFEGVRNLRVAIDSLDVAVVGDDAVASYTRTDDFTDIRTGRPMHLSVRVTKTLRRADGSWKLLAQ